MALKLIQAGVGGHGRGVGKFFVLPSTDFEYAGLVDVNPDALRDAGMEFGVPDDQLFTDYREAFRSLEADAVLIEAFSPAHYEIAKDALENGLHVLIEKPFVLNLSDAQELVELAERNNRNIMINQNYRFFTAVLTLKQAIQEQALGKPLFIEAHFYCDHNGKPYQRAMDNYILLEMSVHHVDMIRFLLDSEISSVTGKTWNNPNSGYQGDPHVQAVCETQAGIPVFYLSSLMAKGISDPWEGIWRIQCENGTIHLDDLGDGYGVYAVSAERVRTKLPFVENEKDGIHGVLAEFAKSIRENREPAISGRDNLQTLAALLAIAESSRIGRAMQINEQ